VLFGRCPGVNILTHVLFPGASGYIGANVRSDALPPADSAPSGGPRGARWLRWAPLVLALVVFAYHVAPIWREVTSWAAWWDCRYYWFLVDVDFTTITRHHELPLWNPYSCGGAPQLANPQAATLSPLTPLVLLFGMPIGYRLGYTVGLLTAALSMRAYARAMGLSEVASAVAGVGFGVGGAFAQHLGGGHWAWLGFALYPLMLRSLYLAVDGRRPHLVWGALSFAIIILHAPIYPFAYAFVTVGVYGLLLGLENGPRDHARLRRAVVATFTIVALGLALGAVRLFPTWQHTAAHPRLVKDWDYTWPWELFVTYAARYTERGFGHHQYVFPEFGNYIGVIGVALVLAGSYVVLRRRRALWPLVGAALVFALFQLGNLVPLPWWLLKHLPIYEHLRVPSRFTIVVGIFFCALIGVAVDEWGAPALVRWRQLTPRRRVASVAVLVLAFGFLVDASSFNRVQFLQTFGWPPPQGAPATAFHQVPGDRARMHEYPRANLGTLSCVEELPIGISPRLRGNLPADEYLAEPDAGTVTRKAWSPNRIELEVDVKRPTTVIVNQNTDGGWRVEGGAFIPEGAEGLLAARVAEGRHTVVFRYLPRAFVGGLAVSLLAAAGALAFLLTDRRARRSGAGAVAR
jgi:hypothetical protein